jgi:ABC-type transport system involved in multi-copper enzyme maturation permease subunit
MTTASFTHRASRARDSYGFRAVAQMEWRKLRTLRSTWYILALFAAGMIGLAVLALSHEDYAQMSAADRTSFDPTHDSTFTGLLLGQLLAGVLGVLTVTSEFSSGMIRATFAAVPRRPLVLAAKAAVLGTVTLAAGEVLAFAAFLAGQAVLLAPAPHATLGQPGVLRAVLMAGAYPALIALIGLGLGAVIRHTAGAICAVVAVLFLLPLVITPLGASTKDEVVRFLPEQIAALSLTAVRPVSPALSPAVAFGLLCAYAAAALAAGAWELGRRDA